MRAALAMAGHPPRVLMAVCAVLLVATLVLIGIARPPQFRRGSSSSQELQAILERIQGRLQQLESTQHDLSAAAQLTSLYVRSQANASGADPPPKATRRMIANTDWHLNASDALAQWRATVFPRMATMYTALEADKYRGRRWGSVDRVEPPGFQRYDLFGPLVACPDGPLQRMGSGEDGGKWLCSLGELRSRDGCVVYSVGSNGQFDFEAAFLNETKCEVHTFDCQYSQGKSQMEGRHAFHPVCLGGTTERRGELEYRTLPDLISMAGHSSVDLLKIDIEGFEFEALAGLRFKETCRLPSQLAIELHWNALYQMTPYLRDRHSWQHLIWPRHELSLAELAVFFNHLAELGYAVVSREDNPLSLQGCCAEFTLVRVERPADCGD